MEFQAKVKGAALLFHPEIDKYLTLNLVDFASGDPFDFPVKSLWDKRIRIILEDEVTEDQSTEGE